MKYINYQDYSRTMDFHNGTVETVWHCGKCMTIKPMKGAQCPYCRKQSERTATRLTKLKALTTEPYEDLL